jgi:hypothetical protein
VIDVTAYTSKGALVGTVAAAGLTHRGRLGLGLAVAGAALVIGALDIGLRFRRWS